MTRFALHGMWPSGPSYKVGLMLAVTQTPHDYIHVDLAAGEQRRDAFLAKNRFGLVPVLEDREANITLSESSVILQYLSEVTGQYGGATRQSHLQAREWQSWAVMSLAFPIYRVRSAKLGFLEIPEAVTAFNSDAAMRNLAQFDGLLEGHDWLVGDAPSFADIDLYAITGFAPQAQIDMDPYPNVRRWMENVASLRGFFSIATGLPKESVTA